MCVYTSNVICNSVLKTPSQLRTLAIKTGPMIVDGGDEAHFQVLITSNKRDKFISILVRLKFIIVCRAKWQYYLEG